MTNDGGGGKCVTALAAAAPLSKRKSDCARIMEIERRKTDRRLLILGNNEGARFPPRSAPNLERIRRFARYRVTVAEVFRSTPFSLSLPQSKQQRRAAAAVCIRAANKAVDQTGSMEEVEEGGGADGGGSETFAPTAAAKAVFRVLPCNARVRSIPPPPPPRGCRRE